MKTKVFIALWALFLIFGFLSLEKYSGTDELVFEPLVSLPQTSSLELIPGTRTLVLFLHPECPCSRATLAELERLMPFFKKTTQVNLIFVVPSGKSIAWAQGNLWKMAKDIPGVRIVFDIDYRETDAFRATTSGQVFLFEKTRRMIFSGGITPGRGHQGDSEGRKIITSLPDYEIINLQRTKVFGCSLKSGTRLVARASEEK